MEIWLDSAQVTSIQKFNSFNLLSGITTNPSLIACSGVLQETLIEDLLAASNLPLAIQVISESTSEMILQAQHLINISSRIIVKVPASLNGFQCMHALHQKSSIFLATAIFTPTQALLAFKAGASYLAPYIGRIEDQGDDPWKLLRQMLALKRNYQFKGKILAAGLRSLEHVENCLDLGICSMTLREPLLDDYLIEPPGLIKALAAFANDLKKTNKGF